MSKIKIIIASFLIVSISTIFLLVILPLQQRQAYSQKIVLAKEIRKVMEYMMVDLRQAQQSSVKGVPADGQWHSRMAFGAVEYTVSQGHLIRVNKKTKQEVAQYINSLRVRRSAQSPDILEVTIEAKQQASLISNFKIRLRN